MTIPPTSSAVPARPDRRARLRLAVERDGPRCVWCRRECAGLVRATTDHLVPKVKGGPSWLENEVLACSRCNRERGHSTPADWLAECESRGRGPALGGGGGAPRALGQEDRGR